MIKIGTCGFSFKDWKGTVYPSSIRNEEILPYYSRTLGMETVEIDASYYALLSPKTIEGWIKKVPEDFLFSVKCHKEMTLNERSAEDRDLPENDEIFKKFLYSFAPLIESGHEVVFLAQFGPIFWKERKNIEYLSRFRERMQEYPLVVEFRHNSWLGRNEQEDTFKFLTSSNLLYAIVDLPQLRSLPSFIPYATGDIAYFRLHGRNKSWFSSGREERYNYLYSEEELMSFMTYMKDFEGKARSTLVYFNNCHGGAALKNATRVRELLDPRYKRAKTGYIQQELPFKDI